MERCFNWHCIRQKISVVPMPKLAVDICARDGMVVYKLIFQATFNL